MPRTGPHLPALTLITLLATTGCRYDGSFMQMDSNAGFPFFGLQLSVDSGSRPTQQPTHTYHLTPPPTSSRSHSDNHNHSLLTRQGRALATDNQHPLTTVSLSHH